eukprot:GDKK01025226.1.p1 GENE.GDKK01025226.1~~GDKK01025226.1.p1  ORF type:complete len:328 (-),score=67.97 GDKK01025226.1:121-1083(-)
MFVNRVSKFILTSSSSLIACRNMVLSHATTKHNNYDDVPAVCLVHGLLGSKVNFRSFSKALHSSEVVTADIRNHGDSMHVDSMNVDEMAQDIIDTMDHLGHKKFYMAGHSLGGKVAMAVALLHPDRLQGLIVLDMSPQDLKDIDRPTTREGYSSRHILSVLAALEPQLPSMSRKQIEEHLKQEMPLMTPGMTGFLMQNVVPHPMDPSGSAFKSFISQINKRYDEELSSWDYMGLTASLPSLFLSGGNSYYVSDKARNVIIPSIFPMAQCKVIEGAGHWVHADKPTQVLEQMNKFMDEFKDWKMGKTCDARMGAKCGGTWL